jgi:DNA-binding MarR family transcriptional regulator
MNEERKVELIRQVMGASHIFCSSVDDLLERTLSEAAAEQLAMSQVKLLLLISRPGQRFKVTDVAEFLGVTNAAASRSIERLVQRGLVDRRMSNEDRRAVDLSLTPMAEELLQKFSEARNRELLRLLGDHPDEKLERVAVLLDELSVLLLDPETHPNERCLRCGIHFRAGCVVRDVLGRECVVANSLYGEDEEAGSVQVAGGS